LHDKSLTGLVAIVTGGASGIGGATALHLSQLGARVAILDKAPATGESPIDSLYLEIDLAQIDAIPNVVARVIDKLGQVDILVNCAGAAPERSSSFLDATEEAWEVAFTLNARVPFVFMQCVARHLVETGRGGRIVNVTSSSAFRANAPSIYSSSKAALGQLSRTAAAELGPFGINVNCVAPGITRTPMSAAAHSDGLDDRLAQEGPLANLLHRISDPEDVAAAIVFLCAPESRQITGQTIHTSAGSVT
jgi:NAD(P)-dependent dehydrogenase (short-subunit alcohol dehydrogenase family)